MEPSVLKVAPMLALLPPAGLPLTALRVELEFRRSKGVLEALWLSFTLPHTEWLRVDREHLFHLDDEVRGPTFGNRFDDGVDIEIEARLADELFAEVTSAEPTPYHIAARLLDDDPNNPFLATESWYGLYVKQKVGPVKMGFQTTWVRLPE
jgi:hypothetical protein